MTKKIFAISVVAALTFIGCGSSGSSSNTTSDVSVPLASLSAENATDLLNAVNTPLLLDDVYWNFAGDVGTDEIVEGNFSCDNNGTYQIVKKADNDYVFSFNKCIYDEDYFDGSVELKCDNEDCYNPTVTALSDVVNAEDGSVVEKAGFEYKINVSDTYVKETVTGEYVKNNKTYKQDNFEYEFSEAEDGGDNLKVLGGVVYINNLSNYVAFDKMIETIYAPNDDSPWIQGSVAFKADGGDIVIEYSDDDTISALINNNVVATQIQDQ